MTRICQSRNAEARMTEGYRWIIRVNFQSPGSSIILCQTLTIFNLISLFLFLCNSFWFHFFLTLLLSSALHVVELQQVSSVSCRRHCCDWSTKKALKLYTTMIENDWTNSQWGDSISDNRWSISRGQTKVLFSFYKFSEYYNILEMSKCSVDLNLLHFCNINFLIVIVNPLRSD